MAGSLLKSKALHHGRSLSFPSTPNQVTNQIDENLSQVKASQDDSSLSSFKDRISAIKKLYNNLDDYLSSPHAQQIISQQLHDELVDQVLDGHIKVLDISNTAKDLFSHFRHNVQDLLSALRRKDAHGVHVYLTWRKSSRKMIMKPLKDLRNSRSKQAQSSDNEVVRLLKEAESAVLVMLESLLSYATGATRKQGNWSFVSKLMQPKKETLQDQEADLNEFMKADTFLQKIQEDENQVKETVNHLKRIESSIQVVEEELETMFRQLIQTRVSLLNRLNY